MPLSLTAAYARSGLNYNTCLWASHSGRSVLVDCTDSAAQRASACCLNSCVLQTMDRIHFCRMCVAYAKLITDCANTSTSFLRCAPHVRQNWGLKKGLKARAGFCKLLVVPSFSSISLAPCGSPLLEKVPSGTPWLLLAPWVPPGSPWLQSRPGSSSMFQHPSNVHAMLISKPGHIRGNWSIRWTECQTVGKRGFEGRLYVKA